jgi:hypothetical protein
MRFRTTLIPMKPALTAEDLWPLVAKLDDREQVRLAKLALRAAARSHQSDAAAYADAPVAEGEFSTNDDPAAWEPEGWDEFDVAR